MKRTREQKNAAFPEPDMKQTKARFRQANEQRRQQLQSLMEINMKFTAALMQAAAIDTARFPAKLRRDLERHAQRVSKAEPPPLPKD